VAEKAGGVGPFEHDTAVSLQSTDGPRRSFDASVAPNWRAGRGPHGGYLAAMLLRALSESVEDPARSPRSLTIHYAKAPQEGPVQIHTTVEREGRSLSTLSARMEQDGALVALVLAAFSVPWTGPEISEVPLPEIARSRPPDPVREAGTAVKFGAPLFTEHLVMQPRFEGRPFDGGEHPMEVAAWLGLAESRPLDALALAFFSDAMIPAPFMRTSAPNPAPTVDLTIHFRVSLPRVSEPDPHELCFIQVKAGVIHEGFFEEDSVIWASDGTVLAQSRQLGLLISPTVG
jgi:acyl-CoA thioesterase